MADTKFGTLQKLLVRVASGKCPAFRSTYTTDAGSSRKTDYDGKVVFLEDKKEIFTHGVIYGASSELQLLKDILRDYIDGDSIKAHNGYTYVGEEIQAIVDAIGTSNLVDFSYKEGEGYVLTDTTSLKTLDNNKITLAGGDSSYSTSLGNAIEVADTKEDIEWSANTTIGTGSYIAATSYAIKDYVETKLGDLAHALRYKGGDAEMNVELAATNLTDENVGDLFVSQSGRTVTLLNGTTYSLEIGDSLIVTAVTDGKVTACTVVERSVDGTVTAAENITEDHVVVGDDNKQGVKDSGYVLGSDDTAAADFGKTTYTLATEKAVVAYVNSYVNNALDALDAAVDHSGILSYSYQQTDGLITYVKVDYTAANATWTEATHTLTDSEDDGFITRDGSNALHSYISYVASLVEAQDHSYTTVATYNATYIDVTYTVDGNDYTYTIKPMVSLMNDYVEIYQDTDGTWKTKDGGTVNSGLADAADVAETIIADEKVIAAALNDHESRISTLETKAADITSAEVEGIKVEVATVGGVVTAVTTYVTPAVVTYTAATASTDAQLTYGTGVLDETAVGAIKQYVDAKTAALDESYTTVKTTDTAHLSVEDEATAGSNDHDYDVKAVVATVSATGAEGARKLEVTDNDGGLLDTNALPQIASYAYNVAWDEAKKAVEDLDVATQTVKDSGNGTNLSFSYSETDGIVTIDSLSYTAASVSTSYLVVTAADNGFVTGYILQETINNLDPWEEY